MKRGRPHQQYYRPGSGLLRKSNSGIEESESDTNLIINSKQIQSKNTTSPVDTKFKSAGNSPRNKITDLDSAVEKLGDVSLKDNQRRMKKPDQEIYVPRFVAQSKKPDQEIYPPRGTNQVRDMNPRETVGDNDENRNFFSNGNDRRYEMHDRSNSNRSKRYSNHRRGNDNREFRDDWTDKSEMNHNREARQASEPRGISNNSNWQRTRDTRSVEPSVSTNHNYGNEKPFQKPPSGRRHSTIGVERLNEIPPRFRKKMLEENKLKNPGHTEESWDGSSITFQGSSTHSTHYMKNVNYPQASYATLPNNHSAQHGLGAPGMYSTLPNRTRGRGRIEHDGYSFSHVGAAYNRPIPNEIPIRSPCNSRPPTPPHFNNQPRGNGNPNSRPQTPTFYNRNNYYNKNYHRHADDKYIRVASEDRYRRNMPDRIPKRNPEERFIKRNTEDSGFRNDHRGKMRGDNSNTASGYIGTPQKPEFRPSLDAQLSPVSPEVSLEQLKFDLTTTKDILDWSEEVELNFKLEAEALSDALTRSSSVTSLIETSTKSMPSMSSTSNRKPKRSGSAVRDRSLDKTSETRYQAQKLCNPTDDKDSFKIPSEPRRTHRKPSRERCDSTSKSRNQSRDCSFERTPRTSLSEHENWREEIRSRRNSEREIVRNEHNSDRSRHNSDREDIQKIDVKKAGVLVLHPNHQDMTKPPTFTEIRKLSITKQKSLFDPNNPTKPIIIKSPGSRVSAPGFSENTEASPPQMYTTDQFGNIRPNWYNDLSEEYKNSHYPNLIGDVVRADNELQYIVNAGLLLQNWEPVENLRQFLKLALQYFLCKDLKFSQAGNIEQHFWKLLYYNIIERTRKAISDDPTNKEQYKTFILYVVDEGTQFFENLLTLIEDTFQFKLDNFLGINQTFPQKGLGLVGLALISAQKIFIFLGDLARYKEQINETTNYGKCRQWYIKAHEINPKNGRPYNQLAVLAVYARRKLDAVYYYMRSLMSSNPIQSARECLISLFEENRKKYVQGERKRREERMERARQHMKQKESDDSVTVTGCIRREIWVRPNGGRRVHRTTQAVQEQNDSEEEDLAALSSVEVNKRFVISYLHVHGKLITKIGMESFQEAALQMLKEFRALLQHSPLPLPSNRILQLLALNMFAIDSTQLKDPQLQQLSGYRSELQERALVISLQMFSLILERCVSLLEEHFASHPSNVNSLSLDANILLPPIKIWCDWMLCHSSVWNPPPSTQDFNVGAPGDVWTRLAVLMNLLEQLDKTAAATFVHEEREECDLLRLPEDSVLCGFTPLMVKMEEPTYVPREIDQETAQFVLRLERLLFFGTEFLCGQEPPVLKLEIVDEFREYVSVVNNSNSRDSPESTQDLTRNNEVLMESFSEDEDYESDVNSLSEDTSLEVRDLLSRKVELEKRNRKHDLHMQRVKKILSQSVISVHIEVRPKYLVPDTNCFIDHLHRITEIVNSPNSVYTLMVPIVVLGELEGLGKAGKSPTPAQRISLDPEHMRKVGEAARKALEFFKKRHQNVKCVTTKGAVLTSTTFTTEDDSSTNCNMKNDDKILSTCLVLCKAHGVEHAIVEGEPRTLLREVVLLTDDRNLRVKALSRDVPVRELSDFMKWAGLG